MDLVRSYFFTNATLTSCLLFSSKLDFPFDEKSGQQVRFVFLKKYVTSYKVHTLD